MSRVLSAYIISVSLVVCGVLGVRCRYPLKIGAVLYVMGSAFTETALLAVNASLLFGFWYLVLRPLWWSFKLRGRDGLVVAFLGIVLVNLAAFAVPFDFGNVLPSEASSYLGDSPERSAANYIRFLITVLGYYYVFRLVAGLRSAFKY
ncbi:MAG: hypothetical protein QXI07_07560 [Pyrobaculum sp.]